MDTLHIRHLQHRSHIHGEATGAIRARVDSALTSLLDDELDAAMLAAGVDLDEEICLRRLHVRGQLNLSRSDQQLATDLSLAWVQELRETIERGGPDVVRYRSRLHALCDMALGVSERDGHRVWAWRQLGLCSDSFDIASDSAIASLVDALSVNVTSVVPVLTTLADRNRLAPLLSRMQRDHFVALAAAGLESLQLSPQWLSDKFVATDIEQRESARSLPPQAVSVVANALSRSPLRVVLARHIDRSSRSVALLALITAEPLLLKSADAQVYLQAAIRVLRDVSAGIDDPQEWKRSNLEDDSGGRHEASAETRRPHTEIDSADSSARTEANARASEAVRGSTSNADENNLSANPERTRDERIAKPTLKTTETHTPIESKELRTEWGGLLFLLSLVEHSGILETIEIDPHLQLRGLRWTLHRLAFALVPLSPDDPVACAFAGIHPTKLSTTISDVAPTTAETRALEDLSQRLVAALRERLIESGVDDDPYTGSTDRLLHTVCRRAARLSMDPGWIEVRLPIDTATTEIRRSGLDRDPDWLPWLGAVVRFIYE